MNSKPVNLHLRDLPMWMVDQLEAFADRKGITMAEYVAEALQEKFESEAEDKVEVA